MNKISASLGWVIAVIIIVGFVFYFALKNSAVEEPHIATPLVTPVTTTVVTAPVSQPVTTSEPSVPMIVANANVVTSDTTAIEGSQVIPNGALTSYWYEYGVSPSLGYKTSAQVIGSGYEPIPAPGYIVGLIPSTTYYVRLVVQNKYGVINGSPYQFQTTQGNPPPVGNAPTARTTAASTLSRTVATLNADITPNTAATSYWFEYGKTADFGSTTVFASIGNGTASTPVSVSISGLTPLTTYYFRVDAENQFGVVNGGILNFQTSGPAAQTAPTVTTRNANSVGTSTAVFRGSVNPNGVATSYWFEYGTAPFSSSGVTKMTAPQFVPGNGVSIVTAVDTGVSGLSKSTTYYVRIVAQNSVGISRGDSVVFITK